MELCLVSGLIGHSVRTKNQDWSTPKHFTLFPFEDGWIQTRPWSAAPLQSHAVVQRRGALEPPACVTIFNMQFVSSAGRETDCLCLDPIWCVRVFVFVYVRARLCLFVCTCIVVPRKNFKLSFSIWSQFHPLWKALLENSGIIFCIIAHHLLPSSSFAEFDETFHLIWLRQRRTRRENCVMSC